MEHSIDLIAHPSTRCQVVRAVRASVTRFSSGSIGFRFRLTGETSSLRIPPPGEPRAADGLWRHTCFEAFLAVDSGPAYHELNFSPSGKWASYGFRGYRDPLRPLADPTAPRITSRTRDDALELEALVRLDSLSIAPAARALSIGLGAVIEALDGSLSYWAVHHPGDTPDFHHASAFALRLEPPGARW